MDGLPTELNQCIVGLLDIPTLLSITCVNYSFYSIALERLFSDITFYADPYTANLTPRSTELLYQLYTERGFRGILHRPISLVRKVTILPSPRSCFRVTPRAFRTLCMAFFQLLQNSSIQSNVRVFQWRMGFSDSNERTPLVLPPGLRTLECIACQTNTTVVFPFLESLTIHRTRDADGEWISRQMQHSKLKRLSISGVSTTDRVTMSRCIRQQEKHLEDLERLGLEHVHMDSWPLPPTACLKRLTLRFCSKGTSLYRESMRNLPKLEALTLVSDCDLQELDDFKRMLWSCEKLKNLALLVGGRDTKVPLSWIRPIQSSLETLILEARPFTFVPALNYNYSLDDLGAIVSRIPNLKVLGLPIDIEREERRFQLPPDAKLQVLHLRNQLAPQQVARAAEKVANYLSRIRNHSSSYAILILGSGQCYRVSNVSSVSSSLEMKQVVDDALYQKYDVSWIETV